MNIGADGMGIVQIEASSVWRSKFSAKMPGNKSRFYDKVILGERERDLHEQFLKRTMKKIYFCFEG